MYKIIFFLLGVTVITSCSSQSVLPDEMPKDFLVELHHDGGMSPLGSTYVIGVDSSWAVFRNMGTQNRYKLEVPNESLLIVYNLIKEVNFERIEVNDEKEVYDRGGYSIKVNVNEQVIEKSHAQNSFIVPKWQRSFFLVKEKIISTVNSALMEHRIKVHVNVDSAVYSLGVLNYSTEHNSISFYGLRDTINPLTVSYKILPGIHFFSASLFEKNTKTYNMKRLTDLYEEIDFTKPNMELSLSVVDGKLKLEIDE